MNEKQQQDRFFDRLESVLPKGATLVRASGSFINGRNSASFVYRHCGKEYRTTLTTEAAL